MRLVEPIRDLKDIRKVEKELSSNKRDLLLFTMGINCGLRISDLIALNVDNVKDKKSIQLIEKKTGKYKQFPINSKLKPMIAEFTNDRPLDEPLFMTRFGNRLNRGTAYYAIREACERAGLKGKFGTHTMRKTFGYHHYKQFKDVVLLQKIFNHSSPSVTLRYIGIEQEEIDDSYISFIL